MSPRFLQARDLLISIDRANGVGIGRQVEEQLREAIRSGTLAPGSGLPSTRALAEDLSVSRGVVVRAYEQLAAEGYLEVRQGANASVRGGSTERERPPRQAGALEPVPKPRYDLHPHQPELSSFPRHAWLRSLRHILRTAANTELGYVGPPGLEPLRVELARYLRRARGVVADPDRVVVTLGSTHTLSVIAHVLGRRGANSIAFENPSHALLHNVARRADVTPVGIPLDEHGLQVDSLRAADVSAVVVTPAHQFPTGVALSADRRAALAAWARESGRLILEDDYNAEFRYDRAPIGAVQGLSPEQVVYMGSTSKTLSPAIRLGWAVLPADLVTPACTELMTTVLQVSGIDQLTLADFLRRGEFDRHMRRTRTVYRRRRDALVAALHAELPGVAVSGIAAGLHVVVELAATADETEACVAAAARGVAIQSLSQHALRGYDGPPGLLIGYGTISEPAIPRVAKELASAIRFAVERTRARRASRALPT
jgi:GntR family transcriptional regulator/MocR family aminotransferase